MGRAQRRTAGAKRAVYARRLLAAATLAVVAASPRAAAAGAIDAVALQAATGVGAAGRSSIVVAAPLSSDVPAPKGDELAARIAAVVAARLGADARASPQPAALAAARAIAGRASALVYVRAEISTGDLRARVDVYPTVANAWDRVRAPIAAPIAHAFASAKIDAEVRSFLQPLLLEQAVVHRARHDEQDVLAAACGDVDGDGGNELVIVSRERVAAGRVRGGRFVVEHAAPWSDLAARAPVPLREPLAGAVIVHGTIAVGTTDRGAVALTADLAPQTPLYGMPAGWADATVCLAAEPSAGTFDGAPFDCGSVHDRKPKLAVPAPRFDAFAAASIADLHGAVRTFVAVREPSGRLEIRAGDATLAPDGDFGAQIALGDLDEDGNPEIATSGDGNGDDSVDVWSLPSEGAELRPRLELSAPAGVRALAMCPPEDGGRPTLVAVVGNEVWLVRATAHDEATQRGGAPPDKTP